MNRNIFSTLVASAMLLFALAAESSAQEAPVAPSPLPGVFGEVLDVRVVNLEAVVTDKDGVPILGLGAADFRLIVDGEEVPIDYFTEVRGGVAVTRAESEGEALPGVPALAPGDPVGPSYLLFIDDYFSVAVDRDRVLEGLIEDLPLLKPEDRMAVVAFDGKDLEMLSTWSDSHETLRRVLKRAKERPARGLQRLAERRQFQIPLELAVQDLLGGVIDGRAGFRTQLDPLERSYIQRLSEQLDKTVAAAAATLRSFAQPPGRKVMLLLSGGWPYLPTDYMVGDFSRLILDRQGLEGENLYRRLSDTANLLGYTLYPVDVPGFDREIVDVSQAGPPLGSSLPTSGLLREQEVHYTLRFLAQETGGRALINASRGRAFERVVSDTRSYYWLGFSPARAWDDGRHEVALEVRDADYRLRSRTGFLDSSRGREVTMAVESTLLFGNTPTEAGISVEVGEPVRKGRGKMEVPLTLAIPLERVTFLPTGQGWATQLELRVAVKDEEGRRAEVPVVPLVLVASESPLAGQVGRYETKLMLRREKHQAVVAVYDAASGRILSSSLTIAP